jgi:hypothetical protein
MIEFNKSKSVSVFSIATATAPTGTTVRNQLQRRTCIIIKACSATNEPQRSSAASSQALCTLALAKLRVVAVH